MRYLPTSAACHDVPHAMMRDLLERSQIVSSEMFRSSRKICAAVERHAAEDRVARGGRLLVDFLEHEVLVAALLRRDRIPQHALRRLRHRAPGVVGELHARPRDDRHLLVAEEHHVARVAQDRGDVGGDEELVLAKADDDRRAVADGDDLFRIVDRDEHDREHAAHVERAPAAPRSRGRRRASRARPGARRSPCPSRS